MATASSSTYEKRWVRQGLSSIEANIKVEATPSIFLVTNELKKTLAEAYTPQRLGLGAYHHLSPNLNVEERQKRALVKKLIIDQNFSLNNFLKEMNDLEAEIRSNYDNYLDLEPLTLAYIMAIDSLYLLAFLQCYHHHNSVDLVHTTLAKDVLKLENQIPAAALSLGGNKLGLFRDNDDDFSSSSSSSRRRRILFYGGTKLYAELFYDFCRAHSPLKLAELRENLRKPSKHLLAHLYYLIVNNQGLKDEEDDEDNEGISRCALSLDLENTVIKPFRTVITILQVCKNSRFANYIFKQEEEEEEEKEKKAAKIEEIQIPSASELSKKFNVDFKPTHRGIRGIKFQAAEEGGGEANTLYLPGIKLESDSEVVLRNLVAYEAALFAADSGSKLELTDYVDLMCGIVDTTEDVKLLRNKGIIEEGGLSDEKIAEMFNGINKSTAGGEQSEEEKSESQKAVEELESKMMWKRACKFCNKIVKTTKELLVKKPAIIAMKYLTYIFLAALLILQILQAYCDIYDCSRKESQTTNVAARLMSVI